MNNWSYAYIFFQSNLLEIPIYILFYCVFCLPKIKIGDAVKFVTLANLMTHPIVFFVIMPLKLSFIENILIAETFAILAETFLHAWIFDLKYRKTFMASLVANLFSWQLAPILTYLLFY